MLREAVESEGEGVRVGVGLEGRGLARRSDERVFVRDRGYFAGAEEVADAAEVEYMAFEGPFAGCNVAVLCRIDLFAFGRALLQSIRRKPVLPNDASAPELSTQADQVPFRLDKPRLLHGVPRQHPHVVRPQRQLPPRQSRPLAPTRKQRPQLFMCRDRPLFHLPQQGFPVSLADS